MSADASGWTFKHSPYSGAQLVIHLAIADVVNDEHDNQFFMSIDRLAAKARASRRTTQTALRQLVADELLEVVRPASQHYPTCYRFLFPDIPARGAIPAPLANGVQSATSPSASPRGATADAPGAQSDAPRGATSAPKPKEPKKNQKPKPSSSSQTSTGDAEPVDDDDLVADVIAEAGALAATNALTQRDADVAAGVVELRPVANPDAWLATAAAAWIVRHGARCRELLDIWPAATPAELAGLVDEFALPAPRTHSASRPPRREPGCERCDRGLVELDDGTYEQCATCLTGVSAGNFPQGATA